MSRVHDALRKAANDKPEPPVRRAAPPAVPETPAPQPDVPQQEEAVSPVAPDAEYPATESSYVAPNAAAPSDAAPSSTGASYVPPSYVATGYVAPSAAPSYAAPVRPTVTEDLENMEAAIQSCRSTPFNPGSDTLLMNPTRPKEAPSEEFRSLRTRLNHLQSSQNLHTIVVSSASPGEGKSFTASNLAISHAQLSGKRILLADFDFRRPTIAKLFGIKSVPGLTDFLRGKAQFGEILHRIADSNLYVLTAGEMATNPLELLNLPECGQLIDALRDHFDWVILDSPPLLFAADGNLLSTMADGTVLVVRIATTTYDSITRAVQSLCENNVLGIVVNGAYHNELYNRYSYYQSYYYGPDEKRALPPGNQVDSIEPAIKN